MPDTPPPAYDPEAIRQIKRDATARLFAIPGVVAVGIGQKVIGDTYTGEPAIKVFVRHKLPADQVAPDELIPPRIDGVVTDIEISGDPVPLTAPVDMLGWSGDPRQTDATTYRPLVGGCRLVPVGSDMFGTGGCLLWDPANHDVAYMLTNYHVVKPSDLWVVAEKFSSPGRSLDEQRDQKCCSDVIGTYAVGGYRKKERDEALVRLAPGVKWQAKIADIGMVTGTYTPVQADVTVPGKPYKVAKRGQTTKVTGGAISAIGVSTGEDGDDNQITIQANQKPGGSFFDVASFALPGDSGSALVNAKNEVVGLIHQGTSTGTAYALRIDHVIERLADDGVQVEVAHATNSNEVRTVPRGAFIEMPPEITERIAADPAERRAFTGTGNRAPVGRPWFSDVASAPRTVAGVRDDLAGCAAGRALIELWDAYGEELRALIGRNRRVTIAWYRGGGAALMQLMLRLPADPSRSLPETLSGLPLMTCVDRLVDAFAREGSAGLADGIRKARALLPDLAGLAYPEIVAALRAKELIPDG